MKRVLYLFLHSFGLVLGSVGEQFVLKDELNLVGESREVASVDVLNRSGPH